MDRPRSASKLGLCTRAQCLHGELVSDSGVGDGDQRPVNGAASRGQAGANMRMHIEPGLGRKKKYKVRLDTPGAAAGPPPCLPVASADQQLHDLTPLANNSSRNNIDRTLSPPLFSPSIDR